MTSISHCSEFQKPASSPEARKCENAYSNNISSGFMDPPVTAKVFVRWWWNGNRLTEKEILRELDVMKAAGIGGVEINPIAFPCGTDPAGYETLKIFDGEWLEMLRIALEGAKQRGMICDMIVGSGWPFGGEFLKKEEQIQMMAIETIDLTGPSTAVFQVKDLLDRVNPDIHSKHKNVYKELYTARLVPKESTAITEGVDLVGENIGDTIRVDVPGGNHVLYCVVKLTGYMAVINGAPGAAGPVLNHFCKQSTESFLNHISTILNDKIGDIGLYIRAMFCDSIELEGANWNDDLPYEFEKRRGYALSPYLPFILKKIGEMGNPLDEEFGATFPAEVKDELKRVELDYYKTLIDLFKERFIDTFAAWCHENNVLCRMQAYGRCLHPLEASMHVDIPECETWLFKDVGRECPNTGLAGRAPRMCNKYVSSAASLAGKRIVSCEEMTNTSMVFMETLENIKIAGDQNNISGVNHSILHGFNYSPPEAVFPGWVRYGTYFSERNTWWPFFHKWAVYKARISWLLQNAIPRSNVAILQPLTDLWLRNGPQRDPFPQKWYPEYQNNLWEVVHQNGGGCDYVSENIINNSVFDHGNMIYNKRCYSVILLPEIETIDLRTARSLTDFAGTGGRIVFIGTRPFKSPSFLNSERDDAAVKSVIDELIKKDEVVLYPAPDDNLVEWYAGLQNFLELRPYVRFEHTNKYLNQSSYQLGTNSLFFIANTSLTESVSTEARFDVDEKLRPWIWDPETGKRMRFPTKRNNNTVQLELNRATSIVIMFEPDAEGDVYQPIDLNSQGLTLHGPWNLKFHHINGHKEHFQLSDLSDSIHNEAYRDFAGEVVYENSFFLNSLECRYLDLGFVHGVSELTLNNIHIGAKWYGAHVYEISDALVLGDNIVSVKITTSVGNFLKSLTDNPTAMAWTKNQDHYPNGVSGPVRLL